MVPLTLDFAHTLRLSKPTRPPVCDDHNIEEAIDPQLDQAIEHPIVSVGTGIIQLPPTGLQVRPPGNDQGAVTAKIGQRRKGIGACGTNPPGHLGWAAGSGE